MCPDSHQRLATAQIKDPTQIFFPALAVHVPEMEGRGKLQIWIPQAQFFDALRCSLLLMLLFEIAGCVLLLCMSFLFIYALQDITASQGHICVCVLCALA